jgi:ribosomal protein L35AE/L33A
MMSMRAAAGMAVLIVAVGLAAGCRSKVVPKGPAVIPTTEEQSASIRAAYQQARPGTVVGRVVKVNESDRLAAVENMDAQVLARGDVVVFVNAEEQIVVTGRVERIAGYKVHVQFDSPAPDQRSPAVGDLAVHVPSR